MPNPKVIGSNEPPSYTAEFNHRKSIESFIPAKPPRWSLITRSETIRLAAITTRAIMPPSFIVSFQNGLRLNTLPKNNITGNASIGRRIMSGANCIISLSTMVLEPVPAIISPQFLRTSTSSNDIVSCLPYIARKIASPIATSLAAIAMAKIVYTHPVGSP